MVNISNFKVNHLKLFPEIYVSRKDYLGYYVLTNFDLRFTRPNYKPVIDTSAIYAIEHLGVTFLRNHKEWMDKTIYFGLMGCRTGFYVIFKGDLTSSDIIDVIKRLIDFILDFNGNIPGASAKDCGNNLDMNLGIAKYYCDKFKREVLNNLSQDIVNYPK